MKDKRGRLKQLWVGFMGGILITSLIILIIGLIAFGIEEIIRKLYQPSTQLWWFVIGAVFLITLGGLVGILWSLVKIALTGKRGKK